MIGRKTAAALGAALWIGLNAGTAGAAGLTAGGQVTPEQSGYMTVYTLPEPNPGPWSLAVDDKHRVWMTLDKTKQVGRLDPATGEWAVLDLPADARPFVMFPGPGGDLWISDYELDQPPDRPGRLFQVSDLERGRVTEWPVTDANPAMFAWAGGAIWFTDVVRGVAGRLDLAGQAAAGPSGPLRPDQLVPSPAGGKYQGPASWPYGILSDAQGRIWYAESLNRRLVRLDPSGQAAAFTLPEDFWSPAVPTVDADGRVWVGAHGGSSIAVVEPETGRMVRRVWLRQPPEAEESPVSRPNGIIATPEGIWAAEHEGGRIARIMPGDYTVMEYPLPRPKGWAQWLAADPAGGVWFAAYGTGQVGRVPATAPVYRATVTLDQATVRRGGRLTGTLTIESVGDAAGEFDLDLPDLPYDVTGGFTGETHVRVEPGQPVTAHFTLAVGAEADLGANVVLAGANSPGVLVTQSALFEVQPALLGVPGLQPLHLGLLAAAAVLGLGLLAWRRRARR